MEFVRKLLVIIVLCSLGNNAFGGLSCSDLLKLLSYKTPESTVIKLIQPEDINKELISCLEIKKAPNSFISALRTKSRELHPAAKKESKTGVLFATVNHIV